MHHSNSGRAAKHLMPVDINADRHQVFRRGPLNLGEVFAKANPGLLKIPDLSPFPKNMVGEAGSN
jgi:hypothetical protein